MIRPSEPAIRDLMAIRRRLLARAILSLIKSAPAHPDDGVFPCETLWLLRPKIQKIAGRMARCGFDFRVICHRSEEALSVEVHPRSR